MKMYEEYFEEVKNLTKEKSNGKLELVQIFSPQYIRVNKVDSDTAVMLGISCIDTLTDYQYIKSVFKSLESRHETIKELYYSIVERLLTKANGEPVYIKPANTYSSEIYIDFGWGKLEKHEFTRDDWMARTDGIERTYEDQMKIFDMLDIACDLLKVCEFDYFMRPRSYESVIVRYSEEGFEL